MEYIIYSLQNYAIVFLLFLLLEFTIAYYYKKQSIAINKGFLIGWQLLVCIMIAIFSITGTTGIGDIMKYGISIDEIVLIPFVNTTLFGFVMNIVMFIPFGIMLPLLWKRGTSIFEVTFSGFFLSLLIEISQLFNWRVTDVEDLIANTLGAIIGFYIYKIFLKRITFFRLNNESCNKIIMKSSLINTLIIFFVYFFIGNSILNFIWNLN